VDRVAVAGCQCEVLGSVPWPSMWRFMALGEAFFRRVREIANTGHARRVSLSVRMEQLGSHLPDFHEIWY
jgi:hypothetical protein